MSDLMHTALMSTLVMGVIGLAVAAWPAAIHRQRRLYNQALIEPPEAPLSLTDDRIELSAEYVDVPAGTIGRGRRTGARDRIMTAIRASEQGLTCDEIEMTLGISHKNASARISEMLWAGVIMDTGRTRTTTRGGKGSVYTIAPVIVEQPIRQAAE